MLTFNEKEHLYFLDGNPMTGVTTILKVISKGDGLIQWAANEAVKYIKERGKEESGRPITWLVDEAILEEARFAHRKKKEEAGSSGTDVHALIEMLIKEAIETAGGLILDAKSENKQVQNFIDWAMRDEVKFLASEKRVYNDDESLWYAGTADFTAEIKGKRFVGDIKTGNQIYPEAFYQMAAYRAALERMGEEKFDGSVVVNINKKGELKVEYSYFYAEDFEAFRAALTIYRRQNKPVN